MKSLVSFITEKFNDAKNGDEFYTRLEDIEKELSNYNFKNQIVYCNCDNPEFSNFWKYFYDNFKKLGLKLLLSTYYSDNPKLTTFDGENIEEKEIESGLFQDNMKYIKEFKVDWVVTNPPYSGGAPLELTEQLLKRKVKFLFCGPLHLLKNKTFFDLYKDDKMNCGYTTINSFIRPDGSKSNAPAAWFTNQKVEHPEYKGKGNGYNLPKYDGTNIIECIPYTEMPTKSYKGEIAVSYRFLTRLNRNQFEVLRLFNPKKGGKKKMTKVIIKYKK